MSGDPSDHGTGNPPVISNPSLKSVLHIRHGAYLPHWTSSRGGVYAVTYRLADSLPRSVLERFIRERDQLLAERAKTRGDSVPEDDDHLPHLLSARIDAYLDAGVGACWLKDHRVAACVAGDLRHGAGSRYRLHAWCVMPNHVHALVEPMGSHRLPEIVHGWKSYTAKAVNRLLDRTGIFWQQEYFDRLIRHETEFMNTIRYIERNPAVAGLRGWEWVSVSGPVGS